jgi:hypothetical protein
LADLDLQNIEKDLLFSDLEDDDSVKGGVQPAPQKGEKRIGQEY